MIQDICTSVKPNSCWMVGAATTIAVRSSDITNVTGPMRKNINRHRQACGLSSSLLVPRCQLRQHRERRGRWKDLSRCRAEVRNGRCGRKLSSTLGHSDQAIERRVLADNGHRIANGNRRPFSDVQQHTPRWQSPT